ncbi:tRNA-specific adenosine deaminase [Trichinella spiralis]|uniref:tRNA-specific adenosine deaminase n=1 Tax=Trichinella spiralis TaxID=6334 RepID=UPI0001EFCA51|nr:tRNA-specific adenosine deaminase [Trichinella spiralis]
MSLYTMINGLKMLKCYHMCFNAKCNNTRTSWKSNQASNAVYVSSYITKRQLFTTHGLPEMIVLNDATAHA